MLDITSKSYCSLFGEHKSDPCPCGWSTVNDMKLFLEDFDYFKSLYEEETGKKIYSYNIYNLVSWLEEKSGYVEEEREYH